MISARVPSSRRVIRGTFAAASVLALGLSLTACSTTNASSTPTSSNVAAAANSKLPDPCLMLNERLIKAAANVSLQPGKENAKLSNANQRICDWLPSSGASPYVQVLVTAGANTVTTQRSSAESSMGAATDVTVTGGDSAYTVANGSILGMAVADYFIQVTYFSGDTADVSSITTSLAKDVAESI